MRAVRPAVRALAVPIRVLLASAGPDARTQTVWDHFYSLRRIWARSQVAESIRARIAFVLLSKLYRQM